MPAGDKIAVQVDGRDLTLTNLATGVERRAVSNAAGNYVLLNIPPGSYLLQAAKTGFAESRVPAFTLEVNQTATIDVKMSIGSLSQSVTVAATGTQVEASTAELGTVMSSRQVEDLPLPVQNQIRAQQQPEPANPAETWAGRGLRPRWLTAAMKGGKSLEYFAIAGPAAKTAKPGRGPRKAKRMAKK